MARSESDNSDVSVVILTKNSADVIERSLKSIIREKPGEVLAVDNKSSDGTLNILQRYKVKTLEDSFGSIGYSRMLGAESAMGDYVLYVDSDAELGPACIARLRKEIQANDLVGVNAMILSAENETYWQRARDKVLRAMYVKLGPANQLQMLKAVYMFKREALMAFPFDPYLAISCEDLDICRRLSQAGFRVGLSRLAVAYHYHRRDFLSLVRWHFRYGIGDARYAIKWGSIGFLFDPLIAAMSETIRDMLTVRFDLVPYWTTSGLAEFLGALVGLHRLQLPSQDRSRFHIRLSQVDSNRT